jgi:hypothetical protein
MPKRNVQNVADCRVSRGFVAHQFDTVTRFDTQPVQRKLRSAEAML